MNNQVLSLGDLKAEQLHNKKVLVRADLNVPLAGNKISDDTRLRASLPTIKYLLAKGAIVILCSHLGRPRGEINSKYSLQPVAEALSKLLKHKIDFIPDCIGSQTQASIRLLKSGSICLLENLRFYAEEETNDQEFSKKLASLADLYVNDAFGSAHRAHASTEGVTHFVQMAVAGFLMEKEIRELGNLLTKPERPFTSIIGGSKVSSKIEIIDSLIQKSDVLLIGGGMAYTFAKAQGGKVGKSLCEENKLQIATELMEKARAASTALILPADHLCVRNFNDQKESPETFLAGQIPDDYEGCDIGPLTMQNFARSILESKTVVWNGPVGIFEDNRFAEGTRSVARAMNQATQQNNKTVIGGGDSAAATAKFGYTDRDFSHISTGGGASLEFLEGKVLPGIAALSKA